MRITSRFTIYFSQESATGLPRDLQSIEKLSRSITLILADGDPGLDLMRIQAGSETRKAIAQGRLSTYNLSNANHGLSKKFMQEQLFAYFTEKYKPEAQTEQGT